MYALTACVENEVIQKEWMDYTADMLCMLTRPHYETEIPLYSELINGKKDKDSLSAEDIKAQVLAKLAM